MIPVWVSVLKPSFLITTSYVPTGNNGSTNAPVSLVAAETENPVFGLTAVTVAAGITAPVVSVTTPAIDARPPWANKPGVTTSESNTVTNCVRKPTVPNRLIFSSLDGD